MNRELFPLFIFFTVLGIVILGASIYVYGWSNVLDFFALIGLSLFVLWGAYKITGRTAERRPRSSTPLYEPEPSLGGSVTALTNTSVRIDTDTGASFILEGHRGNQIVVHQIDPRTGRYINTPFHAVDRWGNPDKHAAARYIKRKARGG
jgi:membrane protein implicated in regulation of membrane protease activity